MEPRQKLRDFLLVSEFSEQVGPVPVVRLWLLAREGKKERRARSLSLVAVRAFLWNIYI